MTFLQNNQWVSQDAGILHYGVEFNFGQMGAPNVALDANNGRENTLELYNYNGLNEASSMMEMFEEWGITPDKDLPTNPTIFAARTCALKNKFNKEITTDEGQTVERAVLYPENLKWYLPAQNQAPDMKDEQYPLQGEYWTSTGISDNLNAYKYTVGGSTSAVDRNTSLRVRAVRDK